MGVFEFGVVRGHMPAGQGQHAQPARSHRFGDAMDGVLVECGRRTAFAERVGAALEQAFERTDLVDNAA